MKCFSFENLLLVAALLATTLSFGYMVSMKPSGEHFFAEMLQSVVPFVVSAFWLLIAVRIRPHGEKVKEAFKGLMIRIAGH